MEVLGIFSKAGALEGEEEQEDAMVRVVDGAWAVIWDWARVGVRRDAGEFVSVALEIVEVEEVEKALAVAVVKVDRTIVVEDKVARRNRALVDCIRIVTLLNDSIETRDRKRREDPKPKPSRQRATFFYIVLRIRSSLSPPVMISAVKFWGRASDGVAQMRLRGIID